jgi:hypothetical protein
MSAPTSAMSAPSSSAMKAPAAAASPK